MTRILFPLAALALALSSELCSAAPRMDSETYTLKPSADQAGGGEGSVSAADYRLGGTVGEVGSAMTSASSYRLSSGSRRLLHYPNTITGLTALAGISVSSVTLQWSAPGQDGPIGRLQPGASYFIVISSNPGPEHFVFSNAKRLDSSIFVSTNGVSELGVPPGTQDSTDTKALVANTTWYGQIWTSDADGNLSFASPRSTFTSLARQITLLAQSIFDVGDTSITISWAALPRFPPDASSTTAEGFVLEASSTNFGALSPGGVTFSSMTRDIFVSTLAVGDDSPLEYCTTYYFRVGTLNWVDATNYATIDPYPTYDDDSVTMTVHSLDIGGVNMNTVLVIPTSVDVVNQGRCPATFYVKAGTITADSPWMVSPANGFDQYTLSAGFNAAEPAAGAFGAEDLLTDSGQPSSLTKFAIGQNAYRVPRTETRTLWFRLQTPSITSTEAVQEVKVEVIAVRDPP